VSENMTEQALELAAESLDEQIEEETLSNEEILGRAALIEALLFANGIPLDPARIKDIADISDDVFEKVTTHLQGKYNDSDESGIELVKVAGKYQFRTKAKFAGFLQQLKSEKPRRLTPAALETLAIIAYRQPIVRSDVERIRGVDATPTIKTLLEKKLIKIAGHQATVGQPALYATTEEFLSLFGLETLSALPSLKDLKEFEQDPGEIENGQPEEQQQADLPYDEEQDDREN